MTRFRNLLIISALLVNAHFGYGQRTYHSNSVLASGNWFKISVLEEGVYKIDVPFLNNLGITGNIPSSQLKIFGNGGAMLPESCSEKPVDDLEENSIMVVDGGDGILNGSDYVLFYASGPHRWIKDSVNRTFSHQKNIYSDRSFYYLTVGGNGLRIPAGSDPGPAIIQLNSFSERYFHELDTLNFLNSGKEWFGEEFSNLPGRSLSRTFPIPVADLLSQQASIISNVAARSVNAPSRFSISVNSNFLQQLDINPVSTALYDVFAQQASGNSNFVLNQNSASVTYTYGQGSFNSQGWLNWFEFFARRSLNMIPGKQLLFRDWNSVGSGVASFNISNADNTMQVWEITDPLHPIKMNSSISGGQLQFRNDVQRLREYICFANSYLVPVIVGKIPNQNLHNTTEKDFLIITYPDFLTQAQRLATFHQQQSNLRVQVVTTDQVYNEFGSGSPDPAAMRDYIKMYYDRYRSTWVQSGKYLLLMGKGSFDYKNRLTGNTNFVPVYESPSSLDPLTSYTSDDFFGFLDDADDINSTNVSNELDIGIGRIPAKNTDEAKNFIDKVMEYHSASSFGPWRNQLNFVADDEDFNLHLQDAEALTATAVSTAPVFNEQKIYLDAFQQESGSSGGRYPQANAVINSNIYNGTLIWNYSGHGGPLRLAEEVVIDQQIVNSWNNRYRLPLFITATCDFAPYDHPTLNSLGENLLVRPRTGAIALMTTTRLVFAFSNRILNNNYLRFALQPDASGKYLSLGEAVMQAKNFTYQTSADIINNRKFTLLGDPAMTLAFPKQLMRITKVNGKDIAVADTLSATEFATVEGEITDHSGQLLNNFQGTAYLTLFDKIQSVTTLGNDAASTPVSFPDQENTLFKGKASIQNGKFLIRFRIPKDINFQYGNGKFSLYAQDGSNDAHGYSNNVIIGGIETSSVNDNSGPEIKSFLNDEKFVNGGLTNTSPILIVQLADSSGINTGGSGVGHDIVATLDGDNHQYFILNNFFETELDNYQKGSLKFQLPELAPGPHTLKIKAWDLMNNSNEFILDFNVVNNSSLKIDHVLNYPNPFTTKTFFWFEHNYPGDNLNVRVEIFTVSGKLIKTIIQTINTPGNRSNELEWNGRDEYGNKIGKGVYIYRLRVRTSDGKTADKWERLVILGK
ncbi:MAG: type IX secretion system sortase PorU [Flavisolibacter sp.]